MDKAPERIWAVPYVGIFGKGDAKGKYWADRLQAGVEYVRADLYEDMIAAKDAHAIKRGEHFDTIAALRAELEQVKRERDDYRAAYKRELDGRIAAERVAGARVVTDEMVKAFIRRSSTAAGDTEACIRAGLEAALAEPAGEADPVGPTIPEWVRGEDVQKMIAALSSYRADKWWFETENPEPDGHCLAPLVLQNMKLGYEAGTITPTLRQIKNLLTTAIFYQQKCLAATPPDASAIREAEKIDPVELVRQEIQKLSKEKDAAEYVIATMVTNLKTGKVTTDQLLEWFDGEGRAALAGAKP